MILYLLHITSMLYIYATSPSHMGTKMTSRPVDQAKNSVSAQAGPPRPSCARRRLRSNSGEVKAFAVEPW